MAGKIQLTPAELTAQSAELSSLREEFSALFQSIHSELTAANSNWSAALANNFASKITAAQESFSKITEFLGTGAAAAQASADAFSTVDAELAKLSGVTDGTESTTGGTSDSFWGKQWEQLKNEWNNTADVYQWFEEHYNELPEWLRKDIEKGGGRYTTSIKILGDFLTGDVSWDTLETFLDGTECDTVVTSAIINSLRMMVDVPDIVEDLTDVSNRFDTLASLAWDNGEIREYIEYSAMGAAAEIGAMVCAVDEVLTETFADLIGGYVDKITPVMDTIGHIIPGDSGDLICNIADGIETLTDTVTGWISGLF